VITPAQVCLPSWRSLVPQSRDVHKRAAGSFPSLALPAHLPTAAADARSWRRIRPRHRLSLDPFSLTETSRILIGSISERAVDFLSAIFKSVPFAPTAARGLRDPRF
jgi:hypothetical protein